MSKTPTRMKPSAHVARRAAAAALIAAPVFLMGPARAAPPIETPAAFAFIMDYETGAALYEKNADDPTAPASMSKLMTVAVVLEKLKDGSIKSTDAFQVSEKAWRMGGSKMWVRVDTSITVENLLKGAIIQSGNDACIVLAENIAGSEEAFADLMNRKAREWGLNNSRFANASGWPDPNQKMSMRDLATLARRIIDEHPDYYALFSEREFTWEKIRQDNRNPILGAFPGADGLKTGHTEESGYGLVASAVKDGVRRIVVLNGLESEKQRGAESRRLLNVAFNDFARKTLFEAGARVGAAEVFAGKAPSVPLTLAEPITLTAHRAQLRNVRATIVYKGPLEAPVPAGAQVGFLRVEYDDKVREAPLFTAEEAPAVGLFGRISLAAKKLLLKPEAPTLADASSNGSASD